MSWDRSAIAGGDHIGLDGVLGGVVVEFAFTAEQAMPNQYDTFECFMRDGRYGWPMWRTSSQVTAENG